MRYILIAIALLCPACSLAQNLITDIKKLKNDTQWQQVVAIPLQFSAYHPQGMVKVGEFFYLSSVEVKASPVNGSTGNVTGHLFKIDSTGKLIDGITLGEGTMYHPGGIDYDGEYIWVPVAEYRPNSQSIIYKVNPATLKATEVMRFKDHIGGIVHNTGSHTLSGISWGSRNFYEWKLTRRGKVKNTGESPEKLRIANPSFYIDYQDCHYVGQNLTICSGLQRYSHNGHTIRLGGFDLISLKDHRPVHQVPVRLWSPTGAPMTQNPFWVESTSKGIRAYFCPDDYKAATLYIYDAILKP
ncbi:DUF6454 family protein [Emticicia fluvialis]|uniref:DUF6454 family protein n=1 Tax=Emticicia fluvialis TaxID=2974474 RepID=UPI0021660409|nr:DUF6454 family protein [Emticicia fluvialis]